MHMALQNTFSARSWVADSDPVVYFMLASQQGFNIQVLSKAFLKNKKEIKNTFYTNLCDEIIKVNMDVEAINQAIRLYKKRSQEVTLLPQNKKDKEVQL